MQHSRPTPYLLTLLNPHSLPVLRSTCPFQPRHFLQEETWIPRAKVTRDTRRWSSGFNKRHKEWCLHTVKRNWTCIQSSKASLIKEDTKGVNGMTKGLASLHLTDQAAFIPIWLRPRILSNTRKVNTPQFCKQDDEKGIRTCKNKTKPQTGRRESSKVSTSFFEGRWRQDRKCGILGLPQVTAQL